MGRVIAHEACPQCRKLGKDRSGDNLARYDDGGAYCFSCGYWEPKKGLTKKQDKPLTERFSSDSPVRGEHRRKLLQKGLTPDEIAWCYRHSAQFNAPVFTLFYPDYLEVKTFRDPKVIGIGDKPFKPLLKRRFGQEAISVLVEDAISAIIVERYRNQPSYVLEVIPLFGSHLGNTQHLQKNVAVWLDPDKYDAAVNISTKLNSLGFNAFPVYSAKDPKDLEHSEIDLIVSGFVKSVVF